ncbi:MAG TPA: hypothetical protein VFP72_13705 [Kineosporiaceae bacterium]|nr:hypothetical protein [Kineosporiaceae bacterium]
MTGWVGRRLIASFVCGAPFLLGAMLATTGPARAATVVSVPSVTPSLGPYLLGVPFTLALAEPSGSVPAVAYQYQIGTGPVGRITASGGTATLSVTLTARSTLIQIEGVAADGTVGPGYQAYFDARAATLRADKDIDGDGRPDLLTVGGTAGMPSGVWQALGTGRKGVLRTPATFVSGRDTTWYDGAQVIMGDFLGNNLQDALFYWPSGDRAGSGAILSGSGDGSPLPGGGVSIPAGTLADGNGNNPLQLANLYDAHQVGLDDLVGVYGDPVNGYGLNYLPNGFAPGVYLPLTMSVASPDGTPWNQWTLATARVSSGTAMYLWNSTSGALYLWEKVVATANPDWMTASITYTQYKISSHWNKAAPVSQLEAADFTGDGIPDLWTVGADGTVRAYIVTDLSLRHPAEVQALKPQSLR